MKHIKAKRIGNIFTEDYPVSGHGRISKSGKFHNVTPHNREERKIKGKLRKEIILLKVEKIKEQRLDKEIKNIIDILEMSEFYDDERVKEHIENLRGISQIRNPKTRKNIFEQEKSSIKIGGNTFEEYMNKEWEKMTTEEDEEERKENITFTSLGLKRKDFTHDFIDSNELSDITLDFYDQKGDFTILHGPITRAGPFEYEKNGMKVIYYKDWDNIMEIHKKQKYYPLKASIDPGSHHAEILGYATNWEPHPETEQMFADIVLIKNIDEVTDLLNPEGGYQVSIGFKDRIENNVQIIEYIDHLAMSLRNKDTGRCLTAGGKSCYAKKKELNN